MCVYVYAYVYVCSVCVYYYPRNLFLFVNSIL